MCGARVLALLALLVGSANTFTWDIVLGEDKRLEFYTNGTLTRTEYIPSATAIVSVTYDPVHYRLLFADFCIDRTLSISSFDLWTTTVQPVVRRTALGYYVRLAYDPVTQLLFWNNEVAIRSTSLNSASSKETVDGNLVVGLDQVCRDIAVDSCGGYIYWITDHGMERARLDGSERKVLIDSTADFRRSLAIDQKTQKIYWTETYGSFHNTEIQLSVVNIDANDRETLLIIKNATFTSSLVVSKDFIYWQQYIYEEPWLWHKLKKEYKGIVQLPRSALQQSRRLHSSPKSGCWGCHHIAAYYTVEEQVQGIKSCDGLRYLISNNSKSECTVSICQNYCLHGNCSAIAEGHPTCSCNAGYSGERCEVNMCQDYCLHGGVCTLNEENKRVCWCAVDYCGEKCEVSICKDYCLHGNCSVGAGGQPKCSCNAGYSGERCEVNMCQDYCLHGGVCNLNEENKRVCQCTVDYIGEKCEVSICKDYCLHGNCSVGAGGQPECSCNAGYSGERCEVNACQDYCLHGNCSVGADGQPKCSCYVGYSGERCEVNVCQEYCLNGGVCTLNEEDEPICQCTAGYDGGRCAVPANKDNSCDDGNSGKETISACHQFCLNDGVCSLNETSEPVCACTEDHKGDRCEVSVNNDFSFQLVASVLKGQTKVTVAVDNGMELTCDSTVVSSTEVVQNEMMIR